MSKLLINQYYLELDNALEFGKSDNEQSIRTPFLNLLNKYAKEYNYFVVAELFVLGTKGKKVRPDGIVRNKWGLDVGLWESKDEKDIIDDEIDAKREKGYPFENIIFEDSKTIILLQNDREIIRGDVRSAEILHGILNKFFTFKNKTIFKFEDAIEKFKGDIPKIVNKLRDKILECRENNEEFLKRQLEFYEICKNVINPDITIEDIREMIIQHLLTSDIFNKIFDDPEFHRHNTIAVELEKLINSLFSYSDRRNLLQSIEHYYEAINATAANIPDHHEKQKFLKVLYENFYKAYNPKAADRLGVIYTPNEIVQFIVRGTDYFLNKHFNKILADKNVEILDPATGTGTFICEIIDNAIHKNELEYKYKNELHANEVAILPYYIANLNIEYTFKQKMKRYLEFTNLCFVDTLDNVVSLNYDGKQESIIGLTTENSERIKRQNDKKISVIIGNPPYNANQLNENEKNKNREYPEIDKRIEDTYINYSKAKKTKLYDMYARFLRWASDRIDKNGIISFVSNNSFIDSKTYDGFRKCVQKEFSEMYIINLKGYARTSGERRKKEAGNVFDNQIRVGIAIYFLIKKENVFNCNIYYNEIGDYIKASEKKEYLKAFNFSDTNFNRITPSKDNYWINIAEDNDWNSLLPLENKNNNNGIFIFSTLGVSTNRDEWIYDFNKENLINKIKYFINEYSILLINNKTNWPETLKWSRDLKKKFLQRKSVIFDETLIITSYYRPFIKKYWYSEKILNDVLTQNHYRLYGKNLKNENVIININSNSNDQRYFSSDKISDLHFLGDNQCFPLYFYDEKGNCVDNISDFGLNAFRNYYKDDSINKESIFYYTYAILYNSPYLKKYEVNLRRELPRIPFYNNFWLWAERGENLINLHSKFETINTYNLNRLDKIDNIKNDEELNVENSMVKLKANKENGTIEIDSQTTLTGIPNEAWKFKLGNLSALEWVLDQYKRKKIKDKIIVDKFDLYNFSDYKEYIIELLKRVCMVSVKTVEITKLMENDN